MRFITSEKLFCHKTKFAERYKLLDIYDQVTKYLEKSFLEWLQINPFFKNILSLDHRCINIHKFSQSNTVLCQMSQSDIREGSSYLTGQWAIWQAAGLSDWPGPRWLMARWRCPGCLSTVYTVTASEHILYAVRISVCAVDIFKCCSRHGIHHQSGYIFPAANTQSLMLRFELLCIWWVDVSTYFKFWQIFASHICDIICTTNSGGSQYVSDEVKGCFHNASKNNHCGPGRLP